MAPLPYVPVLKDGTFLNWDDDRLISRNPLFGGDVSTYVAAAVSKVQFEAYQPLHLLSYLPDRILWPASPAGFHALNLSLFALAIGLLHGLIRRHVDWKASLLACLLFAWHPLLVEPVSWITARKDLLALTFTIGVLRAEDAPPSPRRLLLSLVLTVAALLSKSAAMVIPILVFAWHRWARGEPLRSAVRRTLPSLVLSAAVGVAVFLLWRSNALILEQRPLPIGWDVPGTIGFYLRRVVFPLGLSPMYPPAAQGQIAQAIAFLVGVMAAAVLWRRLPAPARFAIVCSAATLLPVSNLLPLYFRFADRYQTSSLLALVWPCAALLSTLLPSQRRLATVLGPALAVVLALEFVTSARLSRVWRDSISLWTHATSSQPKAFFGHLKLGETHRTQGNWEPARRAYLAAISCDPESLLGFTGLLLTLGGSAEASGRLPAGTSRSWLHQLQLAIGSASALEQLAANMATAGCSQCGDVVRWLSRRLYPER